VITNESKILRAYHGADKVLHDWNYLDVDVVEHGIAALASNEVDSIVFDVGAQKSYGSGGT